MADWIVAQRAVLLQYVDSFSDRAREEQENLTNLRAEFEQYKVETQSEIEQLRAESAEASTLRAENQRLKEQLQQSSRGKHQPQTTDKAHTDAPVASSPPSRASAGRGSAEPLEDTASAARDAAARKPTPPLAATASSTKRSDNSITGHQLWNSLNAQNAKWKRRYEMAADANKCWKNLVQQWAVYADHLEEQSREQNRHDNTDRIVVDRPDVSISNPHVRASSVTDVPAAGDTSQEIPRSSSTTPDASSSNGASPARAPAASHSRTSPGMGPPPTLPLIPDAKRKSGQGVIKQEPLSDEPEVVFERPVKKRRLDDRDVSKSPARAPRVKTESSDSEPLITDENYIANPHLSQDLDSEYAQMPTPRKRRQLPPSHFREREDTRDRRTPRLPELIQGVAALDVPTSAPSPQGRSRRGVLQEISPNRRLVDQQRTGKSSEPIQSTGSRQPQRKDDLSDCQDVAPMPLAEMLNTSVSTPMAPPLRRPLKRPILPIDQQQPPRESAVQPGVSRMDDPVTSAATRVALKQTPNTRRASSGATGQPAVRLRELPAEKLRLADFRINPLYNNGNTTLNSEVVRDKSDRRKMAGCVDPKCCGPYFRALASSELRAAGTPLLYSAASVKLLEDYLGDEAFKLGPMNRKEREQVWLEAKTQDMANKLGKCRHRGDSHRAESPPGYWDPDFPSTQELQRRQREGEKMDMDRVLERRREAMRANGRWIFRDEVK